VKPITIDQATRDPKLLGSVFDWYPEQLRLLGSVDGPERRHIWNLGRQSGKDLMLSAGAVHNCALRPDLDLVLPAGMVRDVLVACPRRDQAQEFIATAAVHIEGSPLLRQHAEILSDRILFELPRTDEAGKPYTAKARILALPANARTTRGHRASMVIFNEQAFLDESGGPGSDEALWRALTPSLRAFGTRAKIMCSSTPNGTSGKFYELCEQAENGWKSTVYEHAATWEIVPNVTPDEIEEWRDELGQSWFDQEYAAEWVDGAGRFFDLTALRYTDGPALPATGTNWVCGLDPATVRDRFGMAIVGQSIEDPEVWLLGAAGSLETGSTGRLMDIDAETSTFKRNLETCWTAMAPYVPHGLRIATDTAKAQAVRSFFGRKGIEPELVSLKGEEMKAAYISVKTRIQDESLRLYEQPDLMEDLRTVQMRDSQQIHLPRIRGRHCDTASALVAACQMLRENAYAPAAAPMIPVAVPYSQFGEFG